jgi:hypothetical protein
MITVEQNGNDKTTDSLLKTRKTFCDPEGTKLVPLKFETLHLDMSDHIYTVHTIIAC